MSELDRVKSYFQSKSIHASTLWIESCIQWYKSEHAEPQLQSMLQEIYEQWLLCDLRDMELGSLPENLVSFSKIILQGKYAVQMHYVIDASQPAYTQLQKIRNKTFISDEDNISHENKAPPSKRCLSLLLCDGLQEVKGMEYKPIRKLSTALTPGVKLLIKGPVECREGVIFLEERNVEILGGEIEDLLVKNAYENVLAREINLPENPNPFQKSDVNNVKKEEIIDLDDIKDEIFDDSIMAEININEITRETGQTKVEPKIEIKTNITEEYDDFEQQLQDADFDFAVEDDYFNINPPDTTSNSNRNEQENKNVLENKTRISDYFNTNTAAISNAKKTEVHENHTPENKPSTSSYRNETRENSLTHKESLSPRNTSQTSITKDENLPTSPKIVPGEPFVYIRQLLNNRTHLQRSQYVVKARFKSLVSKLNFIKNQWSLKCEIEDPTGAIAVNFSNKVLEEIIGYTADEMVIMRREFATNNFHKDQILQALEKAKEKILSLADLITLDFSNFDEPTIVNIRPITYNDLKLLEKRISL